MVLVYKMSRNGKLNTQQEASNSSLVVTRTSRQSNQSCGFLQVRHVSIAFHKVYWISSGTGTTKVPKNKTRITPFVFNKKEDPSRRKSSGDFYNTGCHCRQLVQNVASVDVEPPQSHVSPTTGNKYKANIGSTMTDETICTSGRRPPAPMQPDRGIAWGT